MSTRKIKDAKDLENNELIYFKGHAKATYMSDGTNVEEALTKKQDEIKDLDTIRQNASRTIPSKTSELTNDSGFLTEHQDISHLATQSQLSSIGTELSELGQNVEQITSVVNESLLFDYDKLQIDAWNTISGAYLGTSGNIVVGEGSTSYDIYVYQVKKGEKYIISGTYRAVWSACACFDTEFKSADTSIIRDVIAYNQTDHPTINIEYSITDDGYLYVVSDFEAYRLELKPSLKKDLEYLKNGISYSGIKNTIECWGDSLTQQKYGKYIEGTTVYTHGFGGKTSTYIRDEFLKNHNPNRTQVIWVGRNNYTETDVVIDDVRDIVSTLKHNDFVIMNPPNGYYGEFGTNGEDGTGEMKGGNAHSKFLELEKRLSEEYPSNFLNIRKAVIEGWRMGNVKLLSDFVQPSVGNNVTIEVSNATFLTTYNNYDLERFGQGFMAKIRIGVNGNYDVYKIVEKIDDTHLTIQLEEINRISSGNTVGNIVDSGGTDSIKYLRVMQNADYMCWLYDTTLSTFRKDGIHMTEDGLKLVAQIVSRKLTSMKLL